MNDTFVGRIVGVHKERDPLGICGWMISVDSESVILRRDEAPSGALMSARLVDTSISVLHLKGGETGSQGQKLVTETNAENRLGAGGKNLAQLSDSLFAHGRVAGTVTNKETVVL